LYGDPTGRALRGVTLAVATARERSPSMQVLRRAQDGLFQSILLRDFAGAERYYARAMENAAAILDPALRDRIMRPVPVARVCLLADRGEADAAERFAMPLVAAVSAEFARVGRLAPAEGWLWNCLSFAHRQQGRFADAIDTAQTFLERCRASQIAPRLCAAQGMTALAFAQLDAGMNVEAMTTLEERRKAMIGGAVGLSPDAALARGRVQLALGFGTEAIEHLRDAYRYWLSSSDPRNVYAIEAEYWLGRAYLAVGDARGGWMVAGARRALAASPLQHHRRLAAEAVPSARVATAASPRS
jgi:tetratricopeptide (TPR) repeat protein